ncbi:MAG: hypothetical protein AB1457_16240 [Chloroflexota bacterium]
MPKKRFGDGKDLAEMLGISRPRVTALIKRGILGDAAKKGPNGRYKIDLDLAAERIRKNLDWGQPAAKAGKQAAGGGESARAIGGIDYVTARALNEQYKAAVRKLEYEERIGKLVDAKKVQETAFDIARRVRDGLLNIPDRVSAVLAAEKDEVRVRNLLADEIRAVLSELAGGQA